MDRKLQLNIFTRHELGAVEWAFKFHRVVNLSDLGLGDRTVKVRYLADTFIRSDLQRHSAAVN